ncbi:Regulator of RpoS [Dyadobacter sp. CECT 9623]|uniref:Regulator of RpoS n=1 Tax=Dyadobacter linearis TaxID=2823330 RepID=A0ABM8UYY2_9BACT|nr:response regulator [Dyadobacter sp. CECT 9623]CAG5074795.1 Regulator of RpoS [Dyadobacter sp. CECT 9623]
MKKIYLVDDDEDDRMFARQALESVTKDIEIVELTDGNQLLVVLEKNLCTDPSLVLMDMNMPLVNGMEALSALKSRDEWRHIPVVLFSTSENQNTVKQAYQQGVNAYMVKPSTFEGYIQMAHTVNLCFLNNYPSSSLKLDAAVSAGKNVVIIEDNPDHAELMDFSLKKGIPGLNIIQHSSAESAVSFFESLDQKASAAVDLIILDLYLPTRKHGLDLLAWIQISFASKSIPIAPIVVVSASAHDQDIKASYGLQANAYLIKTAQPAQFFSYLTDLCYCWWNTIVFPRQAS